MTIATPHRLGHACSRKRSVTRKFGKCEAVSVACLRMRARADQEQGTGNRKMNSPSVFPERVVARPS